ncbi:MAG: DNA recombination protein RmuC [Lautropia sp.]|nr:MAG: DNA recombination protein RmuC [Pseudomonadota bacterium]MBC6960521.1 DNA recombination protein RmuC [Lautropia sp.]MCL4701135.1 DNA recombination protein RmuC [Burkholderiaceae bacterium]MCZ2412664.1 DNA recombination protein RmuC [Burkholderiales bacterium]MDL1908851.1 DNA recombination protein RmuC [Betaproteobacteria bacterium PRO1]
MNDVLSIASVVLAAVAVLLLVALALRRAPDPAPALDELARLNQAQLQQQRELREETASQARENRLELSASLAELGRNLTHQMGTIAGVQNNQIDAFALQLTKLTEANEQRLGALRESNEQRLNALREGTEQRLEALRETLERRLRELQGDNAAKLEEMRRTVDEKLHATLEQRLGASFKQVSDRLEQVHKGLGEMQALASDVGDLKRVLSNVKTRGTWGEVQLASLLEQLLVPEQYAANVAPVPGSNERVEFAIRLPGRGDDAPVWLPIDAKFPREDYERLVIAQENADPVAAEAAARQLEQRLRLEAKTIRTKYVSPPDTTDFALMFLPTEGLYAEVVRRPGLMDDLQRSWRVVVAGPSTLAAILSSLQMGFRTLAVEKRSSEVWQLLGAVKTEFGKFGDVLAKTKEQIDRASTTLGSAAVRTRAIERRLRDVESLPETTSAQMLEDDPGAAP